VNHLLAGEEMTTSEPTVTLSDMQRDDYDVVASWFADEEEFIRVFANAFTYPLNRTQFEGFFLPDPEPRPSRRCLRATLDGRTVGMISYNRIDWRNNNGHLGFIAVEPASRSRGIGTQMISGALAIGFADYGLHRIDLYVYSFNRGAIKCYEGLGFRTEGVTRGVSRIGDRYLDWIPMSLLKDEWTDRASEETHTANNGVHDRLASSPSEIGVSPCI
jgi:RimJ/RimL family protein N-acetyltransferase